MKRGKRDCTLASLTSLSPPHRIRARVLNITVNLRHTTHTHYTHTHTHTQSIDVSCNDKYIAINAGACVCLNNKYTCKYNKPYRGSTLYTFIRDRNNWSLSDVKHPTEKRILRYSPLDEKKITRSRSRLVVLCNRIDRRSIAKKVRSFSTCTSVFSLGCTRDIVVNITTLYVIPRKCVRIRARAHYLKNEERKREGEGEKIPSNGTIVSRANKSPRHMEVNNCCIIVNAHGNHR